MEDLQVTTVSGFGLYCVAKKLEGAWQKRGAFRGGGRCAVILPQRSRALPVVPIMTYPLPKTLAVAGFLTGVSENRGGKMRCFRHLQTEEKKSCRFCGPSFLQIRL